MQRQRRAQLRPFGIAVFVQPVEPRERAAGRRQSAHAGVRPAALDRKDRKHRVADELEHLSAPVRHRARRRIEEGVERVEIKPARQSLGHGGGAAQVGKPDRRLDLFPVAAPDRAVEHPPPRTPAEIGVEQGARRRPEDMDLEQPAEQPDRCADPAERPGGESGGVPRREGHRVQLAVGKGHRQRRIVRRARRRQVVQDRVVERGMLAGEAAAYGARALVERRQRAAQEGVRTHRLAGGVGDLDAVRIRPPGVVLRHQQRVQRPQPHLHPPDRNARFVQRLPVSRRQRPRRFALPRRPDQPVMQGCHASRPALIHGRRSQAVASAASTAAICSSTEISATEVTSRSRSS